MKKVPIITLTTDFSLKTPYPAVMKGVILSINPRAVIIDVTHEIKKYDVFTAAFVLGYTVKYFPKGSIHVCVVDPGVGTERRGIIIKCRNGFLVGPDNACLSLAARHMKTEKVFAIKEEKFLTSETSSTFHGRDVFAPVAAYLSLNKSVYEFGEEIRDYKKLSMDEPIVKGKLIEGLIIYIDNFGNMVTNISWRELRELGVELGDSLLMRFKGTEKPVRFLKSYGFGAKGELLVVINSFGFLEISIREGKAKDFLKGERGDKVVFKHT